MTNLYLVGEWVNPFTGLRYEYTITTEGTWVGVVSLGGLDRGKTLINIDSVPALIQALQEAYADYKFRR